MTRERVRPESARDAAEFAALLRELKQNSGRTLRQLEEQAAEQGAVLPRSTTADMLRRDALPRPELLAVFVRACGDGQYLAEWLSARERLDAGPRLDQTPQTRTAEPETRSVTPRRRGRMLTMAAVVVAVALVAAAAWWWGTGTDDKSDGASSRLEVLPLLAAGGWARIHAAGAPDLCVTEGREHTGHYGSAIAVLRPCTQRGLPRMVLQPVGTELATIKWEHPVYQVMGCLTVLHIKPVENMLEPQEKCDNTNPDQLFRIERVGDQLYRLRTPETDLCLGLRDNLTAVDTEALRERCAAEPDQEFLIELNIDG
ncbi:RICIN domain-containing protein [Amycolatopsis silviterrae]|uniref:RICIN domain-containing protein n=1 Tax=Amycolatopsis silviterrae TaxID=1656914 RepID=A0ABW5HGN7_9PSEU